MSNKTNSNPIEKRECICCGGDIKIRNPKGYCDHLYYPENCNGKCTPPVESWEKELEQILIEWEGKDNAILGAVRVLSRTKTLKQFISSQIQQAEEKIKKKIIKELITIRDVEMEGRKDLMKTRAGYNINLLIEDLKEEK